MAATVDKARWTRLAGMGLAMAGLGPLLILAAALAFGMELGGDLVFFLGTAAIGLVAAFVVLRFGTWAKIAGIVAGVLIVMALFWTAFGLAEPASFFDFVPGLLVLPGALIGIVAGIASLIAGRKGRVSGRAEGGERRAILAVAGIVILGAVVSGAMNLLTRPTAEAAGAQVTATMADFKFAERQYEVAGGTEIFVRNDDPFLHTFTVDELEVDEEFVAGASKLVRIPDEPGTYVLYCKPHTASPEAPEDGDMAARITVT